jgi:hypothetical protein
MDPPSPGTSEQVFIHELRTDKQKNTFAAILNEELNLALKLNFNKEVLPRFMEWKSTAAGDYVIGLEPANSSVLGRLDQKKQGLPLLEPFEIRKIEIKVEILDGLEEIQTLQAHPLMHS